MVKSRSIIDMLNSTLQNTNNEITVSKLQIENYTQKVHDLSTRLTTSEEKLKIYEARSSPSTDMDGQSTNDSARGLELQIADLRSEIETAKESIKLEKEKVETYKAIASSSEEQLAHVNSTYDTYKETMDAQLNESLATISTLNAKCADLEIKLARAASEVTIAQETSFEERGIWETEKKLMQASLVNAQISERDAITNMELARADLRRQVLVVVEMQNNYEREVVAHSKNIQSLTVLREELSNAKESCNTLEQKARLSESDNAISKKALIESNARFALETSEFKRRIEEYVEQNNTLHQHLEKVNTQALQLQNQTAESVSRSDTVVDPSDQLHEELRDVIRFLRREKDILSTKHELVVQDNERTKIQIEHVQRNLDETRAVLNEERQKSREALDGERRHAQLVEQVNQLNILRESNVTLRDQAETSAHKILELQKRVELSEDTINPLRGF